MEFMNVLLYCYDCILYNSLIHQSCNSIILYYLLCLRTKKTPPLQVAGCAQPTASANEAFALIDGRKNTTSIYCRRPSCMRNAGILYSWRGTMSLLCSESMIIVIGALIVSAYVIASINLLTLIVVYIIIHHLHDAYCHHS